MIFIFTYWQECFKDDSGNLIYASFPRKYVLIHFLFLHYLLVEGFIIFTFYFCSVYCFSFKELLKIGLISYSIKLNTVRQYLLIPNTEISTTQEIILFCLTMCSIILFYVTMYVIIFFIDSLCCASKICRDYFINLPVWNDFFLGILCIWFLFDFN